MAIRAVRVLLALACALAVSLAVVGPADAAYRFKTPKSVRAGAVTTSTIAVRWTAPRGARGYQVQYAPTSSMRGAKSVRTTRATTTLRSLKASTRYWFRVRVVNPRSGAPLSAFTARTYPSGRTATPTPPAPVVWPSSTPTPSGTSTGPADVRVASFNIFGVNNDASASGEQSTWRTRRPVVVSQILTEHPDVIGLQEANQSTTYTSSLDYGSTQYDDLVGALAARGAHYAVTNASSYNCLKATSSTGCVATYRGASNSTRIIYDTDRLELVAQGSMKYAAQAAGRIDRYLAWGVFRVRATGGELLFADTHLDSYDTGVRVAQWRELITRVNLLKNGRPVVVVGDFNTTKFSDWSAEMLPRMQNEGYGDVLDQQFNSSAIASPRARTLENAWVGSSNGFRRDVRTFSYDDAPATKIGNNIDWVFATSSLEVKDWKTVVDYDPTSLMVTGVIPSDHCMVRATLVIP